VTYVKLGQVASTGINGIVSSGVNPWLDWAARAAVFFIYGGAALLGAAGIPHLLPLESFRELLTAAAHMANVLFLGQVAVTAVTRMVPIVKSKGIETRISALMGTFLSILLAFLPKAELDPVWSILSTALILVATSLCIVVLRWLGKSFSILAEARQLVTDGPYRIVRHPLYLCEMVALAGVTLQVFSPLAVLIAIAVVAIQCRRMFNEERTLRLAFPEYDGYAERTPFLMPVGLIPAAIRRLAHQVNRKLSSTAVDPQA
jgi:protein-S-isoprenylcysteine O-methyltransferase Ste14